jgi:hypothetical protein
MNETEYHINKQLILNFYFYYESVHILLWIMYFWIKYWKR